MRHRLFTAAIAALALLTGTGGAMAQSAPPVAQGVLGTWVNPHGTVKVRTGDCAGNLCGWVVWAAPKAEADARESGVNNLVGTELLRDYRRTAAGHYEGEVYVPDMGHTYYSTIVQRDDNSLRISGCILGGLICKSQDWRRA